jgi:transcriptional regulator with XRE-family HTH domain
MAKRKLPDPKTSVDDLESVRVFRENLGALLRAYQSGDPHEHPRTQAEFAALVGMSLRNLNNVLNGKHAATLRTIEKAAAGLHLETWQLLIEHLPAELALHPAHRSQMQALIRQYLSASIDVRRALSDLLPSPPSRPTAQ